MSGGFQNDLLFFFLVIGALFALWTGSGQINKNKTNESLFLTPASLQIAVPTVNFGPNSNNSSADNNDQISAGSGSNSVGNSNNNFSTTSPWRGKIKLGRGNAGSSYRSSEEYITLQAASNNKGEVNISGWILENGFNNRYYEQNGEIVTGVSKRVAIPFGSILFTGLDHDVVGPITLKAGERAIVTTGSPTAIRTDFDITRSFKTNKCTGYIEQTPDYNFVPSLPLTCPDPRKEIGVSQLAEKCYKYVTQRLGRCRTPNISDYKRIGGEMVRGSYVDGIDGFSNLCKNYLKEHFNYQSCLKYHSGDDDFFKGEWRVYLGQVWEMWAKERETITLYDANGLLVDQIKY